MVDFGQLGLFVLVTVVLLVGQPMAHPAFTYTFIQMHDYQPVEFVRYNNIVHRWTGEAPDDDQRPNLGSWTALCQFLVKGNT